MIHQFQKHIAWMLPGYAFKRWVIILAVGLGLIGIGVAFFLRLSPISFMLDVVQAILRIAPYPIAGSIFVLSGLAMLGLGYWQTRRTMNSVIGEHSWVSQFMDDLYTNQKLARGPKIVAIGGGTGLSTLLRGLKNYTSNITAVVTVGDDGGSSGVLREDHGMIPPGDIRNCIAALAKEEELMTDLFQYRFKAGKGGLQGHSFGNLFITAMAGVTGDILSAIRASSTVLNIRGRVLPSTLEPITLIAEMADGSVVRGESQIPEAGQKIKRIYCEPAEAEPLPEVIEAIEQADVIIMGPGSLYTSVIPNLLLKRLCRAIQANRRAPRVYVANIVTQPGETDEMTLSDHVLAIEEHAENTFQFDMVVASSALPNKLVARYERYDSPPVALDVEVLEQRGTEVLLRPIVDDVNSSEKTMRHNPYRVSRIIISWLRKLQKRQRLK